MVLHGAGFISAQWMNPNPKTPPWVFAATGLFLVLGGFLALSNIVPMAKRLTGTAAAAIFATAIVMMNWMVFFAEGTSCSISGGGFIFEAAGWLCTGVTQVLTGLFDLLIAAVVLPYLWQRLAKRPAAP